MKLSRTKRLEKVKKACLLCLVKIEQGFLYYPRHCQCRILSKNCSKCIKKLMEMRVKETYSCEFCLSFNVYGKRYKLNKNKDEDKGNNGFK
jgi:hypothetical protein